MNWLPNTAKLKLAHRFVKDPSFFPSKILPEEDDYGFDMEEKNKAILVKSVRRGSHAEVKLTDCSKLRFSIRKEKCMV